MSQSRKSRSRTVAVLEKLELRIVLTTYNVPTSIAHDYSTDVTAQLQAYVDSIPDGTALDPSVIAFPTLGYDETSVGYKIEGTLSIREMHHVVYDGNDAHFRAFNYNPTDAQNRRHWSLSSTASNIVMHDITVVGADPTPGTWSSFKEAQHGIDVGGSNTPVDNVDIYSVAGYFIYIGRNANGVTIKNSHFEGSGRQGIAPCNASNTLIYNNYIGNFARHMFDAEPYTGDWKVRNLRITGNTTEDSEMSWLVSSGRTLSTTC
jgi:hypothetical protein